MQRPYPFTRLLIPYDGSPSARKALEWATHLVLAGGPAVKKVSLLRVLGGGYLARHIQNVDLRTTRMNQVDTWRRLQQRHLEQEIVPLLEEAQARLQEEGVTAPVEILTAEGKVGEEIIRLAAQGGYDAVVMGRRGLSTLKGMFMGSVTREVLGLAKNVTVFVVGPDAVIRPDCSIFPLLFPLDGSWPSQMAVQQGTALAQYFPDCLPSITLLHVVDFVLLGAAHAEDRDPLVRKGSRLLSASRRILEEAGLGGKITEKLPVGAPAQVIAEEAAAGNCALILMGARGLSPLKQLILGGVSSDVLRRVSRAAVGLVFP